ncbi:MAG: heparinase II/III family protein [Lentisphaerae bacterium]|nr:heparinase II/III family protein [Lentisphaerota bacterium]
MLIGIHITNAEAKLARAKLKAHRDFERLRRVVERYLSLPNGFDIPPPGSTESKTFKLAVYEVGHMAAALSTYHAIEPTAQVEQALTRFLRWTLDQETLLWGAGFTQGQFLKGAILALDAVGETFPQSEREAFLEHLILASIDNPDPAAPVNNHPKGFHPLRPYLEIPGVGFQLNDEECNNWNILAAMGMLYVARATDALLPRRATDVETWTAIARRRVEKFMDLLYTAEGEYGEGPGYYSYATTGAVLTLDLLRRWPPGHWWRELPLRGLLASPLWSREMCPREIVHGSFNINDCHLGRHESSLVIHWIAARTKDAEMQKFGDELMDLGLTNTETTPIFHEDSIEPIVYSLLWRDDQSEACPPRGPRTTNFGRFGTVISRTGYTSDDVCLFFRCGATAGAHTQADRGTFLLTAYGENLVSEGGCPHDRWSTPQFNTFHRQTWAHNCAMPTGQPQQLQIGEHFMQGRITAFKETADGFSTRADCSEVYPGAGRVERALRFSRSGWMLVHDFIENPGEAIEFLLHTDNRDRQTEIILKPKRAVICRPKATLLVFPLLGGEIKDTGANYQDSDPQGLRSLVLRRAATEMATLLIVVRPGDESRVTIHQDESARWTLAMNNQIHDIQLHPPCGPLLLRENFDAPRR